jgi:hypothetical protein
VTDHLGYALRRNALRALGYGPVQPGDVLPTSEPEPAAWQVREEREAEAHEPEPSAWAEAAADEGILPWDR